MISGRKKQIIDIAAELLQTRSFSAFSFQDIADQLGVSKAAIHSHFRTKEILGNALVEDYLEMTIAGHVSAETNGRNAWEKFDQYIKLIESTTFSQNKACLATILLVEYNIIPESMRNGILHILQRDEEWLAKIFLEGKEQGEMEFKGSANHQALLILSAIQNASIVSRAEGTAKFEEIVDQIKTTMLPV